jgi:prepilin-type N-terminal cleavage/methylation domain-containing protein
MTDRRKGFTLIEIILVLVLIGILFGVVVPKVENLTPKYALRAAARSIGSQLEYVRSNCILRRQTFGISYDFELNRYRVIMPPPEGDPDLPLEEWPRTEPTKLPSLVRFHGVVLADNSVYLAEDEREVTVLLDPLGTTGSHVAILEDDVGHILSVKFNALTGTVDFYEEAVGFARYD